VKAVAFECGEVLKDHHLFACANFQGHRLDHGLEEEETGHEREYIGISMQCGNSTIVRSAQRPS
jgi:hypothetical protein